MMSIVGWTGAYRSLQADRITQTIQTALHQREAKSARTIPDETSVRMHDGRSLPLAILYLDICGFSQRRSCTEAEQDKTLKSLAITFSEFFKIVNDYGGMVEKNTGDGFLAYFEGDNAQGSGAPERLIACALTIFGTSEMILGPRLVAAGLEPFDFRMSADFGLTTVARIGAPRLFNALVAIGSRANIAGKMLSKASKRELLIGADLAAKLPETWQSDYVDWRSPIDSDFFYRVTRNPYWFFRYHGRWEK